MAAEKVTFKGKPLTLSGPVPHVGDRAPEFTVHDKDFGLVRFSDFKGKVVIISSAISLDTSVCSRQLKRFNDEIAKFGGSVAVLNITMDLPFRLAKFVEENDIRNVKVLSDYKDRSFGRAFGLVLEELGMDARAVIVIDHEGTIKLIQVVPEQSDEPDYRCVLNETEKLLAKT